MRLRRRSNPMARARTGAAVLLGAAALLAAVTPVAQARTQKPALHGQHWMAVTGKPLAATAGMRVALLTGRERARERPEILTRLADGEIDLIVGTHALFQDDVTFRDLALAIVDEQHRFGVHQRLALARKGAAVDLLVLTATPIPRTLVLTYFGDMDVSELREKPAGRQKIDTRAIPLSRLAEVEDVANAVEYLLSDKARNITGTVITVDAGATA